MSDSTFRRPVEWRSFGLTDVGKVREVNEDAILGDNTVPLWAVADGMGGHAIGEVASQKIVEALTQVQPLPFLADSVDLIEDTLLDVNEHIIGYADIMFDDATMGSTVVSLYIHGTVGVCIWAGDSRLYRLRNGRLEQLSRDHSHVEEMVRMGVLSAEQAQNHPNSNVITRAVGIEHELALDINIFSTQIGDTFLLCSDGLYNAVDNEEIRLSLKNSDVQFAAKELVDKALINNASDNVSVVIVRGAAGKVR